MSIRQFDILILTVGTLCLCACTKAGSPEQLLKENRISVRVDTYCTQTKAGTASDEVINTLDILVFRSNDSVLDAYTRVSGNTGAISVTAGMGLDYYIVANAPVNVLSSYLRKSSFLSDITTFSGISDAGFLFLGEGTGTFDGENNNVDVELNRYACKIGIDNIIPAFMDTDLGDNDVVFTRSYLINVNGTEPWSRTAAAGEVWYSKMAFDTSLSSGLKKAFLKERNVPVVSSDSISANDVFYCFPNPTDNDVTSATAPEWSIRNTRLVLEFSIGGNLNYYPIDVPAMESNKFYHITNVTLIGPGSSSPDIPVERQSITYTIEVNPWGSESQDIVME